MQAESKRNLYVNPPKKGTYGFPDHDRTIGGTKVWTSGVALVWTAREWAIRRTNVRACRLVVACL
eukprot:363341-Chlamydomonas_euryale.AAC.4